MSKDTMRKLFERFSGKRHLRELGQEEPSTVAPKKDTTDKERELDTLKAALVYEREQYRAAIRILRHINKATLKIAAQQKVKGTALTRPMADALRELGLEPEEVGARELAYKPPSYVPDPCETCGQGAKRGKTKCRRCLQGLPPAAPPDKKKKGRDQEHTHCKWCLRKVPVGQVCPTHGRVV